MTKVVSTRLSETEHKKLLDKCNGNACTQADLLKDIVTNFLNGENQPVEEPIELPDSGWKLPAGSIFKDGGIDLPNGGVIFTLDDDKVKRIEECVGHKCQSNKELSDAIIRIIKEVGKR